MPNNTIEDYRKKNPFRCKCGIVSRIKIFQKVKAYNTLKHFPRERIKVMSDAFTDVAKNEKLKKEIKAHEYKWLK